MDALISAADHAGHDVRRHEEPVYEPVAAVLGQVSSDSVGDRQDRRRSFRQTLQARRELDLQQVDDLEAGHWFGQLPMASIRLQAQRHDPPRHHRQNKIV